MPTSLVHPVDIYEPQASDLLFGSTFFPRVGELDSQAELNRKLRRRGAALVPRVVPQLFDDRRRTRFDGLPRRRCISRVRSIRLRESPAMFQKPQERSRVDEFDRLHHHGIRTPTRAGVADLQSGRDLSRAIAALRRRLSPLRASRRVPRFRRLSCSPMRPQSSCVFGEPNYRSRGSRYLRNWTCQRADPCFARSSGSQ
jgi:hypothetical protein